MTTAPNIVEPAVDVPARGPSSGSHARFRLHLAGGKIELPGLVCRNTRPGERPWRLNVFTVAKTRLAFPHLTFNELPEPEDIAWNLENQLALWSPRLHPIAVTMMHANSKLTGGAE